MKNILPILTLTTLAAAASAQAAAPARRLRFRFHDRHLGSLQLLIFGLEADHKGPGNGALFV